MASLTILLEQFPTRELEIHRLRGLDPDFRRVCDDYEVAVRASRHWKHVKHDTALDDEYRQLAAEIADEIAQRLDAKSASNRTPESIRSR